MVGKSSLTLPKLLQLLKSTHGLEAPNMSSDTGWGSQCATSGWHGHGPPCKPSSQFWKMCSGLKFCSIHCRGKGSESSALRTSARLVPNNCRQQYNNVPAPPHATLRRRPSNACDNAVKLMPRRLLYRSCHCSADGFGMAPCILSLAQGRNWPKAATGFGMEP